MTDESLKVSTTITAPAEAVFAVLSDPVNHPAIDGTGWVTKALDTGAADRASGQMFRMAMYHANHPDGSYEMVNRVAGARPAARHRLADRGRTRGRRAAWSSAAGSGATTWLPPDRLRPRSRSPTTGRRCRQYIREYIQFPPFGPEHLTNSLHHLAELAASS